MKNEEDDLLKRLEGDLDWQKHGDYARAARALVFVVGVIFSAGMLVGWCLGRMTH